jgi:hemolysin D
MVATECEGGLSEQPGPNRWGRISESVTNRLNELERFVDRQVGGDTFANDQAVVVDFKPDANAIEEAPIPLTAHIALYTAAALVFCGILWATFGSLDRIVVAQGKITTRTPLLVMQPFVTSRILAVKVKAGDHVRKGDLMVKFDPAFAQADAASLRHKVENLTALISRLEAQISGNAFPAQPGDSTDRLSQGEIFGQESSDYQAEIKQRESRLNQIDSQAQLDSASLPGIRNQLEMNKRVAEIQNRLRSEQAASELDVMRAQTAVIDAELKLRNTLSDQQKMSEQHAGAVQERLAYIQKWRSDHTQQLVKARQELAEASETLNKASRMKELTEMTAPVAGTVLQVADRSEGSVLKEAETLLTLVPDGANLFVEANVPSRDVSYLRVGDTVRVKLEAYPFQQFGTLNGELKVISADSIPLKQDDAQSQRVYRVDVRLTDPIADLAQRRIRVRPGLVSTAEIKTGKRSIMSYILDPVLRTTDESMREP